MDQPISGAVYNVELSDDQRCSSTPGVSNISIDDVTPSNDDCDTESLDNISPSTSSRKKRKHRWNTATHRNQKQQKTKINQLTRSGSEGVIKRKSSVIKIGQNRCLICGVSQKWKIDKFILHMQRHRDVDIFACFYCQAGFTQEEEYLSHVCSRDRRKYSKTITSQSKILWVSISHFALCIDCGDRIRLSYSNSLKINYLSLDNIQDKYRKVTIFMDENHLPIDLNVLPKTVRLSYLSNKVVISTSCKLCSVKFHTPSDVLKHLILAHADQDVCCIVCHKQFKTAFEHHQHLLNDHNDFQDIDYGNIIDFLTTLPTLVELAERREERLFGQKRNECLRGRDMIACDLCCHEFLPSQFNLHDCCVNYTRRILVCKKVYKCFGESILPVEKLIVDGCFKRDDKLLGCTSIPTKLLELMTAVIHLPIDANHFDGPLNNNDSSSSSGQIICHCQKDAFVCNVCGVEMSTFALLHHHLLSCAQLDDNEHLPLLLFDGNGSDGEVNDPLLRGNALQNRKQSSINNIQGKVSGLVVPTESTGGPAYVLYGNNNSAGDSQFPGFVTAQPINWITGPSSVTIGAQPNTMTSPVAGKMPIPKLPRAHLTGGQVTVPEKPQIRCPICSQSSTSSLEIKDHLLEKHLFPCNDCGLCYTTSDWLRKHQLEQNDLKCSKTLTAEHNFTFFCAICKSSIIAPVKEYYSHLIVRHASKVSYKQNTGEVVPKMELLQNRSKVREMVAVEPESPDHLDSIINSVVQQTRIESEYQTQLNNHQCSAAIEFSTEDESECEDGSMKYDSALEDEICLTWSLRPPVQDNLLVDLDECLVSSEDHHDMQIINGEQMVVHSVTDNDDQSDSCVSVTDGVDNGTSLSPDVEQTEISPDHHTDEQEHLRSISTTENYLADIESELTTVNDNDDDDNTDVQEVQVEQVEQRMANAHTATMPKPAPIKQEAIRIDSNKERNIPTLPPRLNKQGCTFCHESFIDDHHADVHIAVNHTFSKRACPVCQLDHFWHFNDVKEHVWNRHVKGVEFKDNKCPLCSYPADHNNANDDENMLEHFMLHCTRTARYLCIYCSMPHRTPDQLIKHRSQVHTNVTYLCAKCDTEFKWEDGFKRHYIQCNPPQQNTEIKPLDQLVDADLLPIISAIPIVDPSDNSCPISSCKKECRDNFALIVHLISHTKLLNQYCFVCQSKFPRVKDYTDHLGKHKPTERAAIHAVIVGRIRGDRWKSVLTSQDKISDSLRRLVNKQQFRIIRIEQFAPVFSGYSPPEPKSIMSPLQSPPVEQLLQLPPPIQYPDVEALGESSEIEHLPRMVTTTSTTPSTTTSTTTSATVSSAIDGIEHVVLASEMNDLRVDDQPLIIAEGTTGSVIQSVNTNVVTNDDDIIVLDDDDENTQLRPKLISTISLEEAASAERRKKERIQQVCPMCKKISYTKFAYKEHLATHKEDAGLTCEATLPIPPGVEDVWVCRVCCLAYVSEDTFKLHLAKHNTYASCADCSAVCFTRDSVKQHREAHSSMVFGCSICFMAMRTEIGLHMHLEHKHQISIIWICKQCNYANVDYVVMKNHLQRNHNDILLINSQRMQMSQNRLDAAISQEIAICAQRKLHFQPQDPKQAELAARCQLTVGECPHRTFNATAETVLACQLCGTLVPASRFMLEDDGARRQGQIKLTLIEDEPGPTTGPLRPSPNLVPPQPSTVPRLPPPMPPPIAPPAHALRMPIPTRIPTTTTTVPAGQQQGIVGTMSSHQLSSLRSALANIPVVPQGPTTSGLPVIASVRSGTQPSPSTTDVVTAVKPNLYCNICKIRSNNYPSHKVHMLKHNKDHHFCLECGASFEKSQPLWNHARIHVSKQKWNLDCPICPTTTSFSTKSLFWNHLTTAHKSTRRCISEQCDFTCFSDAALGVHTQSHATTGATLCSFCGYCSTKQQDILQHEMSHSFDKWFMCRDCGLCYKAESQLLHHFTTMHQQQNTSVTTLVRCMICMTSFNRTELGRHFKQTHEVSAIKMRKEFSVDKRILQTFLGIPQPAQPAQPVSNVQRAPLQRPSMAHPPPVLPLIRGPPVAPVVAPGSEVEAVGGNFPIRPAGPNMVKETKGFMSTFYQCQQPDCKLVFGSKTDAKAHMPAHEFYGFWPLQVYTTEGETLDSIPVKRISRCSLCEHRCEVLALYDHCRARHSNLGLYPCKICGEEFMVHAERMYHMQFNHNTQTAQDRPMGSNPILPFMCMFCSQDFNDTNELLGHVCKWHSLMGSASVLRPHNFKQTLSFCMICGMMFNIDGNLRYHFASHEIDDLDFMDRMSHCQVIVNNMTRYTLEISCGYCKIELENHGCLAYEHFLRNHVNLKEAVDAVHASPNHRKNICRICKFAAHDAIMKECECLICRIKFTTEALFAAHLVERKCKQPI